MPYLNVTEVESALSGLSAAYPSLCELITLPNATHEGRTCHAVRIGLGPLDNRPAMLFIGGQHAREWGSCEILVNVAADLCDAYTGGTGLTYGGKNFSAAQVRDIVERSQVFVFACVNPDGRNYSQFAAGGTMWRKNRNPAGAVDLNRNYDFLWDFGTALSPSAGAVVSGNPASDTYHGTAPHSEPEARNVVWLLDTHPQIRWMIDVHSYSKLLYYNWGDDENQITDPDMNFRNGAYDGTRGVSASSETALGLPAYQEYIPPGDQAASVCLVTRMRDALQAVRGVVYDTGQSFDLYPTTGTATDYPYSRCFVDPTKTKTLGFLIEWGTEFQPPWAEMENIILDVSAALIEFAGAAPCTCSTIEVELLTPGLAFTDVPEGETTFRAATFSVVSCRPVHFEIVAGPTVTSGPPGSAFGTPLGSAASVPGATGGAATARLWISYHAGAPGTAVSGTVTVRCTETGEEWVIPISANAVPRPTAVVALVFDQSNSMNFMSGIGPGITRGDVLRFSAPPFVDVIQDGHGVGIIQFDQDAHDIMPVTVMDFAARLVTNGHIGAYSPNPTGWTSIGEAVARAHDVLAPESSYAVKAIVVLTDGQENHDGYSRRYISDVADLIDERVYAIGLGTAANLNPAALQALCDGHEGYLLMTDNLDPDAYFRLAKYYQQILAGVTNHDIVRDPEGWLTPGQRHRIPFRLTEADITADVILLTPAPMTFRFELETPGGDRLDPGTPAVNPSVTYRVGKQVAFYRLTLPVPVGSASAHGGVWHAVLTVDEKQYRRYLGGLEKDQAAYAVALAHGVRYSLSARAYSNLRLRARVTQNSFEPGATLTLRAVLTEYGIPVENRAAAHAELERPDGTAATLPLAETEAGVFEATTSAGLAGGYRFRVLAAGKTLRGLPFTREQLLTAAVWRGGDKPPPNSSTDPQPGRDRWCRLLKCLLSNAGLRAVLAKAGLDVASLEKCLRAVCDSPAVPPRVAVTEIERAFKSILAQPQLRSELERLLTTSEG